MTRHTMPSCQRGSAKSTAPLAALPHKVRPVEIEVEKGIPIPGLFDNLAEQKTRSIRYPFQSMEIGDCFALPLQYVNKVRNAVDSRHRWYRERFAWRTTQDTVRVWRVA